MNMNGEWLRLGLGGVVPISWDLSSKANEAGELEGWASVFHNVDQQDDIVVPGAFKKTLADWRASGRSIPLSKDHGLDADSVIGSLSYAEEMPYGLRIRAKFASTPDAQALRTKAREDHIKGLSIFGPIFQKGSTTRDGRPIRILREVGLLQVALTPYPANMLALTTAAKGGAMTVHHTAVVDQAWNAADAADALAHHVADGPAVISAVRSALARLSQTQGLSDAERESARAHLQAHLDDFNKSAGLDSRWEEDMRAALRISSAPVRRVAIEQLIKARFPDAGSVAEPGAGETAAAGDDVSKTTDQEMADAAAYALALIGDTGPSPSPGGEPNPSLVDLEAFAAAEKTSAEIDALHAELRG